MPKGERGTSKAFLRGKIWWIRYKVPGEDHERRESSKSENKPDAVRLLNTRRKEIDDRLIVSASDAAVSDLLKLYLEDQKREKRSSIKNARRNVVNHLLPAFGRMKASKLETKHIERFIDQKQDAGFENASINRYLASLRRAFTLGMEALPPPVYSCPKIKKLTRITFPKAFWNTSSTRFYATRFRTIRNSSSSLATTLACGRARF